MNNHCTQQSVPPSTLIDNSENGYTMTEILRRCISIPGIDHIRIATGYWDLKAIEALLPQLQAFLAREGSLLQILIGKDPYVYADMVNNPKYRGKKFPEEYFSVDIAELDIKDEHQQAVNFLVENLRCEDKLQIHSYHFQTLDDHNQRLHSKCFIFTGQDEMQQPIGYATVGSSNFTLSGLEGNSELNYFEVNKMVVLYKQLTEGDKTKGHVQWFEEKWQTSEPWNQQMLEQLLKTPMGERAPKPEPEPNPCDPTLTPYELYIKLLQIRFGNIVDKTLGEQIVQSLPKKYNAYDYQIDAVKQCLSTMKEHGGFILADVVGLGKTIVGTLLIKHFLQFPDEEGREHKVLVVTPPAIQSSWKRAIREFDEDHDFKIAPFIDFITTGSIGKLTDEEMTDEGDGDTGDFDGVLQSVNYGLILIDESHKFRNSTTSMYEALDTLIANIGTETGVYPYVGLLSATPQNNRPADLQNQIYLFERNHTESTLKKAQGGNLEGFFAEVNRRYAYIMHPKDKDGNPIVLTKQETNALLKALSLEIRNCVLADIMVRRTRTDVQKYYANDKEKQGMHFPLIKGPLSLEYKMSPTLARLFYDSMMNIAPLGPNSEGLRYYRYRAIQFLLKKEDKEKYKGKGSRDADTLAEQLAKIMQISLVKRLESSFTAFKQSLLNLRQYTQNMITMWGDDCIFICPQMNINAELDRKAKEKRRGHKVTQEECYRDIRAKIAKLTEEGRNDDDANKEYHREDFDPCYIDYLRLDLDIINELCARWSMNCEDPKFDVFKEELRPTLFNKNNNRPQKLVIFSEAIDTARSIAAAAESKGYRTLLITAENRDDMEVVIRENFDANYGNDPKKPKEVQKDDLDIIVTTDVLAEGINLHRANCILNYDTPWNSTRLMQRIGRVNRIGSTEDYVYVYNFMPSAQGDGEIALVQKAHNKLQSFHTLFGEDSQVFTDTEEVAHYDLNTQVNGEESPMEKYVFELKQYKEQNPERYAFIEQATEGLELSTVTAEGTGYFLVRTPRMSGMFVEVNPAEAEGRVLSLVDGLEAFRTAMDTKSADLPTDWERLREEAERVVLAELASIRILRSNSRKATVAKGAIIDLKNNQQMSAESKKLLNKADKLIRQGNNDIVKRVLKLAQEVADKSSLFQLSSEEFDAYLSEGLAKVVANAKDLHGNPEIVVATYK